MALLDDSSFLNQVCIASTTNPLVLNIKHCFNNNHYIFKIVDSLLYFGECLYNPKGSLCLQVLQVCHDFLIVRHFGFKKILEFIYQKNWWHQMQKAMKFFVLSCNTCFRPKTKEHHLCRLLQLLPISNYSKFFIFMDLINNLSPSNYFDTIYVIVDQLKK